MGAKTCYLNSTTKLTTHFPVNEWIVLIYCASLNSGCFCVADYDSNTNSYVRQYQSTDNIDYAILTRYNTTDKSGTYEATYARFAPAVTINPSTGALTAPNFIGNLTGNVTGSARAHTHSVSITSTSVTPTGYSASASGGVYTFTGSAVTSGSPSGTATSVLTSVNPNSLSVSK